MIMHFHRSLCLCDKRIIYKLLVNQVPSVSLMLPGHGKPSTWSKNKGVKMETSKTMYKENNKTTINNIKNKITVKVQVFTTLPPNIQIYWSCFWSAILGLHT